MVVVSYEPVTNTHAIGIDLIEYICGACLTGCRVGVIFTELDGAGGFAHPVQEVLKITRGTGLTVKAPQID